MADENTAKATGVLAWLCWVVLVPSVLVAGYTAFLFRQAEGRDLWQSKWLFWHLLAQASMVGAGGARLRRLLRGNGLGGCRHAGEDSRRGDDAAPGHHRSRPGRGHKSRGAAVAARVIVRGRDARLFWLGSVAPVVLALILGAVAWNDALVWAAGLAGLLVQPALLVHETAFVRAGQDFIDHPLVRVPRTSAPPSPAAGCAVLARRRGSRVRPHHRPARHGGPHPGSHSPSPHRPRLPRGPRPLSTRRRSQSPSRAA